MPLQESNIPTVGASHGRELFLAAIKIEKLAPMGRSYEAVYRASQPPSTGITAPFT
jgi:hypothetical protein